MTRYRKYLESHAGTTQISELIAGTDIPHATMSRYLAGTRSLKFSAVATMCQKYNLPLLQSLVEAEFITEAQAETERRRYSLGTMTDQDLAAEVLRRLQAATDSRLAEDMDQPVSDVTNLSDHRRKVTAQDVTEEDLMSEAAYLPDDDETPDRDNY